MQQAIDNLISVLANIAGNLLPFKAAKAIVAGIVPTVIAIVNTILAGQFNTVSLLGLITAVIAAISVYLVPNKPAVTPVPVKRVK